MIKMIFIFFAMALQMAESAGFCNDLDSFGALRLNHLQVVGTHNSFKAEMDPGIYNILSKFNSNAKAMDYFHKPIPEQLERGIRSFELDIFYDPQGGLYSKPLGLSIAIAAGGEVFDFDPNGLMSQPGYKVLHVQDIDFRSNAQTLEIALKQMKEWSDENPRHLPIFITMNINDSSIPFPGTVQPLEIDKRAFELLEQELLQGLGRDRLIVPDDIRGSYATLKESVLAKSWPLIEKVRGKFLFVMDEGVRKQAIYLEDHANLEGRLMFIDAPLDSDNAAIMIINSPKSNAKMISEMVCSGFIVRTRADAETKEMRESDLSRFEAAKKSGANIISSDYCFPDKRYNSDYVVQFENGCFCRQNPVSVME